MKYHMLFLSLLSIVLTAASCKKQQTGANIFSCKIDGVPFKPSEQKELFGSDPIIIDNLPTAGFSIVASKFGNSTSFPTRITLQLPHLNNPSIYNLNNYPQQGMYEKEDSYITDAIHTGVLTIKQCDTINQHYFGTFYFTAINNNTGTVVKITDGVFDVKR